MPLCYPTQHSKAEHEPKTRTQTHTHARPGHQKHNVWNCRRFDCRDLSQTWMNLIWCVCLYRTVSFKDRSSKTRKPIWGRMNRTKFLDWWRFEFKSVGHYLCMCVCMYVRMGVNAYLRWMVCVCGWLDVCVACHKYNLIMVCYYYRYYCVDCCLVARRHVHKYWARFYSLILSL